MNAPPTITRYGWYLLQSMALTKVRPGLLLKGNAVIYARAMAKHGWVEVQDFPQGSRRKKEGLAVPGLCKITRKGRELFAKLPVPKGK